MGTRLPASCPVWVKPNWMDNGLFGHDFALCFELIWQGAAAGGTRSYDSRYNSSMLWLLRTVGWFACVIYATIPSFWLAIHSRAEFWRRRRSPYLVLLPMWVAMWIVLAAITVPVRHATIYSSLWAWAPALALFAAGFWLYSQARHQFSLRQLGGLPELISGHSDQRLVTFGVRARVRHPVYLGHLCEMLAWSVGTGLAVCYGLTVLAIASGAIMIRHEDAELERRFGEDYREYRNRVPAVLPKLR